MYCSGIMTATLNGERTGFSHKRKTSSAVIDTQSIKKLKTDPYSPICDYFQSLGYSQEVVHQMIEEVKSTYQTEPSDFELFVRQGFHLLS